MGISTAIEEATSLVGNSNGIGDDAVVGRALVIDASLAGTAISVGVEEYRVVNLRLQVFVDGQQAYLAECRQTVEEWRLAQLVGQAYAVRVDRQDPMRLALDFSMQAPVVTMPRPADGRGSAATVLATGTPAEEVIVSNTPLGLRSWDGHDVHLFVLTVIPPNGAPYQTQLGNPMPASALPHVFPGSRVPVKVGANPGDVAIDWSMAATR
jgi:hypothetical protein